MSISKPTQLSTGTVIENTPKALEGFLEAHLPKPLGAYGLDSYTLNKSYPPEKVSQIYRSLIAHSFGVWDFLEDLKDSKTVMSAWRAYLSLIEKVGGVFGQGIMEKIQDEHK